MNGANLTDLALLWPELILVGTALALILVARRIQQAPLVAAATVVAALAAAFASGWLLSGGPRTGFGGMIILDGYSQFFKVLIASALALAALLSVRRIDAEHVRPAEYHALLVLASTGMMFAVSALDLVTLYLGLELMTLCSYSLVGITVERPTSNEGSNQILPAGFLLFGRPPLRYCLGLRSHGCYELCSHCLGFLRGRTGRQSDSVSGDRPVGRRACL